MAFVKACTILLVAGVVSAQYGGHGSYGIAPVAVAVHKEADYYAVPEYDFAYAVHDAHTNDIKEQKESRHGDKTEGYYSFLEADGTTRTVKYTVDGKSGFVAQVIREGKAVHAAPAPRIAVAPVAKYIAAPIHVAPVAKYAVAPVAVATGHSSSYQTSNVVRSHGGYGYGSNNNGFGGGYGGGYGGARSGYGGSSSSYINTNFGGNRGGYGGNAGYGRQGYGY